MTKVRLGLVELAVVSPKNVVDGELAVGGALALAFEWLPLSTAPNRSPRKRNARNTTTTKATTISMP